MAGKKRSEEENIKNLFKPPIDFRSLKAIVDYYGVGILDLNVKIPSHITHLASKSLRNFFKLPTVVQLDVLRSYAITGKYNVKNKYKKGGFIFQMGKGGTQQIKEYKPEIYRNERNTPLRLRSRMIVHLAVREPAEKRQNKIRELYRTYPYYLVKDIPIRLRMKNFYFKKHVKNGEMLTIYRTEHPEQPDPQRDYFYSEKEFSPKKVVGFQYEGREEEYFYALNNRNGEISTVLHFIWQDDLVVIDN